MYIEKCRALLNNENVNCEWRDQTKCIHSKVVKQLLGLKISVGPKFKDQYIKLHSPSDNVPPGRFYSLSKIHKAISFRPIVSACGTYTYKLAKFLTKILSNNKR